MEVYEGELIELSVSVEFIPNGRINVSFDGIIEEINSSVKYPELEPLSENDLEIKYLDGEYYVVIDGETYASVQTMWGYAYKYSLDFSNPIATMIVSNCGSKYFSNLIYAASSSEVEVMIYVIESGSIVIQNVENEEMTIMSQSGEAIVVTYPDGSTKELSMKEAESASMSAILLLGIADSWYGEEKISYSNTDDLYICYDKATGEYEIVSRYEELHEYELDEANSVISNECGSFSYYHYVCSACGESYGEYVNNYHDSDWTFVLPEGVTDCEDGLIRIVSSGSDTLYFLERIP